MYFEFLFRGADSRSRVERMYWSGVNLNSFTTCSKEVTVGTTGPIGSGLPQFGFPRRFAISCIPSIMFGLNAGSEAFAHFAARYSPSCAAALSVQTKTHASF